MKKLVSIVLLATTISSLGGYSAHALDSNSEYTKELSITSDKIVNQDFSETTLRAVKEHYNDPNVELKTTNSGKYIFNIPSIGYYSESQELGLVDGHKSKYSLTENGKTIEYTIDYEHSKVTINDKSTYELNDFIQASKEQSNNIENKVKEVKTRGYSSINTSFEEIIKNYKEQRCSACGKYSPNSPPTSGYNKYISGGVAWSNGVTVAFTQTALTAIGIFCAPSAVASSYIRNNVARKAVDLAVAEFGNSVLGKVKVLYYDKTYASHPICYRAASEKRKYYWVPQNKEYSNTQETFYFYSSNPN